MGGAGDKDLGTDFVAHRIPRERAERLYQASWAARRMVDLKVDDMFAKARHHTDDDELAIETFEEAEEELDVAGALSEAMKAGRLYGSSLLIICTEDGDFESPLEPEDVEEGSITNLWVVDRWACSVETWVTDPRVRGLGKPYTYRVSGRSFGSPSPTNLLSSGEGPDLLNTQNLLVNRDRVFRFDGIAPPLTEGWTSGPWQREWGISILVPAIDEILRQAANHAGVGHLVQEASIWVQKIHDFKESLMGRVPEGEPTADELALEVNALKSIYRTMFIDAEDDAERVNVTFAGLRDILDASADLLAMIEGVPVTRFRGTSATGLNATGEGDARDWRITVAAMQKRILTPVMRRMDRFIGAHCGVLQPLTYEWLPLGEMTDGEAAAVTKERVGAALALYQAGAIDEDELREIVSQDEWIGELGPYVPTGDDELDYEAHELQVEQMRKTIEEPARTRR